jgi:hypothetical protein
MEKTPGTASERSSPYVGMKTGAPVAMESYRGVKDDCELTVVAVNTEVSPFPHIATILKSTHIYQSTKKDAEPEMAVRLFGTSIGYGEKTAASFPE